MKIENGSDPASSIDAAAQKSAAEVAIAWTSVLTRKFSR
jgi:hypothetical protein